ncbi:MAG: DCC1-like thiol-disulfide oxidoreductase family protein [Pseudomonadota bacterium]|nr:DCC1-like thiol-disulfide oxidoreductase family protein [Pseudomonadota bacterium]
MLTKLFVLYDADCGFCTRCARWLAGQRRHLRLECLPNGSPYIGELFPGLRALPKAELTVIDDQGGVYRGTSAWLMCLWALEEYRPWAARLATPALRPFAREAFELVSTNRRGISALFGLGNEAAVAKALQFAVHPATHVRCADGHCSPSTYADPAPASDADRSGHTHIDA